MAEIGTITIGDAGLTEAVRELATAVRYQGDNIASLMQAAQAEADALNSASFGPTQVQPVLKHGFETGDRVVLFNGDGILRYATADFDHKIANAAKNIPVKLSNGLPDAWPVRMVLKVDPNTQPYLDTLTPPTPFGKGKPPKDANRDEWNRAACLVAEEEGAEIRFAYRKPAADAYDYSWRARDPEKGESRRIKVVKFEEVSTRAADQVVHGIDLDLPESSANRYRTFRLDRITDFVEILG